MPGSRTVSRVATAAVLVGCLGVAAVWLVLRPGRPDCAIVHDMLKYSQSENDRISAIIPQTIDDPQRLLTFYEARSATMHRYADEISNSGLREKANAVVDLDDGMLDVWRQTIRESSSTNPGSGGSSAASQRFARTYTDYAARRHKAAQELQAACSESS